MELLIVVVVIAVLAAITIAVYGGIRDQAIVAAHKNEIAQVEKAIMAHAALQGVDSGDIGGDLIGYQEGAGERRLLRPLSGVPDITMYMVCSVQSLGLDYQLVAELTPRTTGHGLRLNTGMSGSTAMGYRLDTSAASNVAGVIAGVRIVGESTIGWVRISDSMTTREYAYNQAAPQTSYTFLPGNGWNFTGVSAVGNSSCAPQIVLVFDSAHTEAVRTQVIGWLAQKYGVNV